VRIAISADGPNLNAKAGYRFGTSQYLVIVDVESGDFEAKLANKIHLSAVSVIVGPIKDHLVYFMANVTPISNGAD